MSLRQLEKTFTRLNWTYVKIVFNCGGSRLKPLLENLFFILSVFLRTFPKTFGMEWTGILTA